MAEAGGGQSKRFKEHPIVAKLRADPGKEAERTVCDSWDTSGGPGKKAAFEFIRHSTTFPSTSRNSRGGHRSFRGRSRHRDGAQGRLHCGSRVPPSSFIIRPKPRPFRRSFWRAASPKRICVTSRVPQGGRFSSASHDLPGDLSLHVLQNLHFQDVLRHVSLQLLRNVLRDMRAHVQLPPDLRSHVYPGDLLSHLWLGILQTDDRQPDLHLRN